MTAAHPETAVYRRAIGGILVYDTVTVAWIGKITVNEENGDIRSPDLSPGWQSLVVRGALARIDTRRRQIEA